MRVLLPLVALLTGCAPLVVGPGRVLPPALQYEPTDFAAKPAEREATPPERITLPNRLEIFWSHDGSAVALVELSLLVRCGRVDEPVGLAGVSTLLLRTAIAGGSGEVSPTEATLLSTELRSTYSVDDGEMFWSTRVPIEQLAAVSRLLHGAVTSPMFDATALDRARRDMLDQLANPDARGAELRAALHRRTINGNLPGLAAQRTENTVSSIEVPALRAQAGRCFTPSNVSLTISGAVDEATVRTIAAPWTSWTNDTVARRVAPPTPARPRRLTLQPISGDSTVKVVVLGKGLPVGTTERAAGNMLMNLLQSHLTWELREGFGHVYEVESDMEVGPGSGATWISFTTRREVAHEAVRRTIAVLQSWWARWPVDRERLERAKKASLRFYARSSVSGRTFAAARRALVDGHADELPWSQQLERLRPGDLSSVFASSFRPEELQVLVVGDVDLSADWKGLGVVEALPTARP